VPQLRSAAPQFTALSGHTVQHTNTKWTSESYFWTGITSSSYRHVGKGVRNLFSYLRFLLHRSHWSFISIRHNQYNK